jgi:aminopeptidase N
MRFALFAAALLAFGSAQARSPAPPPPAAVAAPAIPRGQLSDAVRPVAYRLDLTVDPAQPRFSGRVEIDAVLAAPSRTVILHGHRLAMRQASATIAGRTIPGTWREADPTGVAVLTFPEALPAGPVTLDFAYDAAFNDNPAGLFRVKVGEDWYSWTQLQSIDARSVFPSFDQPSFKAPFTVTLRTPPGLMAISNAPEASTTFEAGLDVHRFAPTLPLPTYLVAMMVGPFVAVAGEVAPTAQRAKPLPLRVVSTRPNAAKLDFALAGSQEIVRLLEDFFADGFPYPKLDQITSPILPGAMENAGADLYDDALIVMDPNAPVPQRRRFGMVVSHELAHQWFGDLVTPTWWDDIWLNESFANWMGYRIGDAWRPELNIRSGALAEGFNAMETDALTAGRPIRQKIETNSQIDAAFDGITYGKGGHVIAMIAGFMGEEKFREGVRRYLAGHRHGNATSADFFAALAEAAGDPRIVPAMRGFTDQQGVPLLIFRHDGAHFTVTQSRYAPFGTSPAPTQWDVPMCVRRGTERHCQLLTGASAGFTVGGSGPLIPNADGTGYYRFEMSSRDWDALIAAAGSMTGGEAQAAADSLAASVRAGRASVEQLAKLARNLVRHPDSYASDAAAAALSDLVSSGVVDAGGRRGWRVFRGKLYAPLLKDYGFDPRAGAYAAEDPERAQRRVQIVDRLAGSSRDRKLRRTLIEATEDYLAGDADALDHAWFGTAFDLYVDRGGSDAAQALVERALASEDPVFRPAALAAVSSSGSKSIATWLLYELDDPRLRASEKHDLLRGVMYMRATRDIGYQWLREHIDALTSGDGGIFFAARLPRLFNRFCSAADADEIARIFRPRFAGKPGELELERAIERVRNCSKLQDAWGAEISAEFAELG